MTRLSILFLLTFSFIIYCEQREVYYSDLANKEAPSPLVVFYERASTVISCGVKCFNDKCCVRFIYNTIGKQCMGFHVMESDVYFYQQAPSWSSEMQQFRKGCASDWVEFKGHCYFFGQQTVKWSDAKFECQNMCSYLVEIEDKEEADWLAMTFLYNDNCPTHLNRGCTAWTGLNDLDTEGQYVWDHSNTSMVFTNWHIIEPSLYNPADAHTRDCVDMYRTGEWNDRPCSYDNPFICEKINF